MSKELLEPLCKELLYIGAVDSQDSFYNILERISASNSDLEYNDIVKSDFDTNIKTGVIELVKKIHYKEYKLIYETMLSTLNQSIYNSESSYGSEDVSMTIGYVESLYLSGMERDIYLANALYVYIYFALKMYVPVYVFGYGKDKRKQLRFLQTLEHRLNMMEREVFEMRKKIEGSPPLILLDSSEPYIPIPLVIGDNRDD